MNELWEVIPDFPNYSVSTFGNIRTNFTERPLEVYANQSGLVQVGLMRDGKQYKRSVPLLVSKMFIPTEQDSPFDTPINLDGDRFNNHIDNLAWRPRWFAIKYHKQFKEEYVNHIPYPIECMKTGDVTENSFECAKRYGLLEDDIVLAILNNTYAWPTYQQFRVKE